MKAKNLYILILLAVFTFAVTWGMVTGKTIVGMDTLIRILTLFLTGAP